MKNPYALGRSEDGRRVRIVIQMPKEEVEAIDLWGVPAGMHSRNAAARQLVKDGLRTSGKERSART